MTLASGGTGEGATIVLVPGPAPEPLVWTPWILGALVLLASAAFAYSRSRRPAAPSRRMARVFWSALACSAGLTLLGAFTETPLRDPVARHLAEAIPQFVQFTFLALILLAIADLLLDLFQPRRSLGWALAAIVVLPAFAVGLLLGSGKMDGPSDSADVAMLLPLIGAALVWWSHLPGTDRPVTHIFE